MLIPSTSGSHTVDDGVIDNLLPLLTNSSHAYAWNFIIGHFLDIDHVGHHIGPDHPIIMYPMYGSRCPGADTE
jgi:hypothetical protein